MRILEGIVHTMAAGLPTAAAVAYDDDGVRAVGDVDEVRAVAGTDAEVVELGGRAVVPGFVDAHHHLSYSLLFELGVDCHPEVAPTLRAIVRSLREAARALPAGAWVVGIGFDERYFVGRRGPTRGVLDAACPDHPVFLLHYSGHEACVNTRGLRLANVRRTTRSPSGGRIVRDWRGEATGRLVGTAMTPAERLVRAALVERGADDFVARLPAYQDRLFAVGITRLYDPVVPPDLKGFYERALAAGALTLPCVISPHAPGVMMSSVPDWLDHGAMGDGDDRLRIGPAKILLDVGERPHLALTPRQVGHIARRGAAAALRRWSLTPLAALARGRPRLTVGRRLEAGFAYYDRPEALALAREAVARGFSLAIHAIGNRAAALAVDMLDAVGGQHPDAIPPRIEHGLLMEPETMRRAAEHGAMVVTQPDFIRYVSDGMAPQFPPDLPFMPLRTTLAAGLGLAASSDYPAGDIDPLQGLRLAVRRRTPGGDPVHPEEALSPAEVLRAYTREAARACGCLDVTGTLEVGKRADLAVLSQDPCAPGVDLDRLCVVETVLGGATVYRAG